MFQEIFRSKDAVEDFVRRLTEKEVWFGVSSLVKPQGGLRVDADAEVILEDNLRLAVRTHDERTSRLVIRRVFVDRFGDLRGVWR